MPTNIGDVYHHSIEEIGRGMKDWLNLSNCIPRASKRSEFLGLLAAKTPVFGKYPRYSLSILPKRFQYAVLKAEQGVSKP